MERLFHDRRDDRDDVPDEYRGSRRLSRDEQQEMDERRHDAGIFTPEEQRDEWADKMMRAQDAEERR